MIVRTLEAVPYAIPLRDGLGTARGNIGWRRGVVVRLHGGDGRIGLGDAAPHPLATAESIAGVHAEIEAARSWLAGAEIARLDELLARAGTLSAPAAMGIDMALHDLAARARGVPLCELLGGCKRATIEASALLSGDPSAAARAAQTSGFAHAKLKAERDAQATLAAVAAVRAAAPGLALRLDANEIWSADQACSVARALRGSGLEWIEQPVAAGDLAGLARVREAGDVPVAADEAATGPGGGGGCVAARAADVVVVKLFQVGGLAAALATAAETREAGLTLAITTGIDTGIAAAAALHLAAAVFEPIAAAGVATGHLLAGDLVRAPIADGPRMAPPLGPGLGVALDAAALARWRVAGAP